MRVFILATAALAASMLASAPAAAQGVDSIAKLCPDMTFREVSQKMGEILPKYEWSKNPVEAEQQIADQLCPSSEHAAQEQDDQDMVKEANVVQQAVLPPPPPQHRRLPPPPRRAMPPHRMMPPQVHIPRLPPPPPGYGQRRPAPPRQAMASARGVYHVERHRSMKPRALPLTSSVRGEGYCLADRDPDRFAMKYPAPHQSCQIGPVPGQPCPGWVCTRSR